MNALRALLAAAAVALVAACAGLDRTVAVAAPSSESDADLAARQVLVMLRLAPPRFRPDAGYGGNYDASFGAEARQRVARELAQRHGLHVVNQWPMPALGVDCFVMT